MAPGEGEPGGGRTWGGSASLGKPWENGGLMGFYSDSMGFYSDLMGFYCDLMGFIMI